MSTIFDNGYPWMQSIDTDIMASGRLYRVQEDVWIHTPLLVQILLKTRRRDMLCQCNRTMLLFQWSIQFSEYPFRARIMRGELNCGCFFANKRWDLVDRVELVSLNR